MPSVSVASGRAPVDTHDYRPVSHYAAHIKLALPAMCSQMGHLIVQLTDSMMLGHYDTTALAASAFGQSVFVVGLVFCVGFTLALTPLVSAARGAGDVVAAVQWLIHGLVINLAMALLVTLLLLALYPWLDAFGQAPEVTATARPYYLLLTASLLPVMVFQTFRQFTEGLGNTRLAAIITALEALLNLGLNYMLIFGHGGVPTPGYRRGWSGNLAGTCCLGGGLCHVLYPLPHVCPVPRSFTPNAVEPNCHEALSTARLAARRTVSTRSRCLCSRSCHDGLAW